MAIDSSLECRARAHTHPHTPAHTYIYSCVHGHTYHLFKRVRLEPGEGVRREPKQARGVESDRLGNRDKVGPSVTYYDGGNPEKHYRRHDHVKAAEYGDGYPSKPTRQPGPAVPPKSGSGGEGLRVRGLRLSDSEIRRSLMADYVTGN